MNSNVIYKIINKVNGKFYLGSSINFKKRKWRHINDLLKNKHHNVYLQRAFNKHGIYNFIFKIIDTVENKELLKKLEQCYLDNLNMDNSYNISRHASGGDLLTDNPNRELIIDNIKKSIIYRMANMSSVERKNMFGRSGSSNGNWKGGSSIIICPICNINRIGYGSNSCAKCHKRTGVNNPFYGKKHSKETMLKIKNTKINNIGRKYLIFGKEYNTISSASKILNINHNTLSYRINSDSDKNKEYIAINSKINA